MKKLFATLAFTLSAASLCAETPLWLRDVKISNKGNQRYYIQSAYRLDSDEKVAQEQNSLRNVDDSFKKIVIVGNPILVERDNNGITTMSVYDFLLKENSLEL